MESAIEQAKESGRELGMTAAHLIQRTLAGSEKFLTKLERELEKDKLDAQSIRSLLSSWKDLVLLARTTHGLDNAPSQQQFNQVNNQFIRLDVLDSTAALTRRVLSARESMNDFAVPLSVTPLEMDIKS
jgi:hypothetical protein